MKIQRNSIRWKRMVICFVICILSLNSMGSFMPVLRVYGAEESSEMQGQNWKLQMIQEIQKEGIKQTLEKCAPDFNINEMILNIVKNELKDGAYLNLGDDLGKIFITFEDDEMVFHPSGILEIMIGDAVITKDEMIQMIEDVCHKIDNQYINESEYLKKNIDQILEKATQYKDFGTVNGEPELQDFLKQICIGHIAGMIDDMASQINVDTGIAFQGFWKAGIDSITNQGNLKTMMEYIGFDIKQMVNDFWYHFMDSNIRMDVLKLMEETVVPDKNTEVENKEKKGEEGGVEECVENVFQKKTAIVGNKTEFMEALKNPDVGVIFTNGDPIVFESWFGSGRACDITRDLVIAGGSVLKWVSFHVKDGATLTLDGDVVVDNTRMQMSFYETICPIEVHDNSNVVLKGMAELRTDYGTGYTHGYGIHMVGKNSKAYIATQAEVFGTRAAVHSEQIESEIVIDQGTFRRKKEKSFAVESPGNITVHDCRLIENLWIGPEGRLIVEGGRFNPGMSQNERSPIVVSGTAYITGGTIIANYGKTMELDRTEARVYMMAAKEGDIVLGKQRPYVGNVKTIDHQHVSVAYQETNGFSTLDGIYCMDQQALDFMSIVKQEAEQLDTRSDGKNMYAKLQKKDNYVYGKYYLADGRKNNSEEVEVRPGAKIIVYGPAEYIQHQPITDAVIEGDEPMQLPVITGIEVDVIPQVLLGIIIFCGVGSYLLITKKKRKRHIE